jgi:hypothetical protein
MHVENLDALIEDYILADDARQLYRAFKEYGSLKKLATETDIGQLITEFNNRAQKTDRSLQEAVEAYAILISLTVLQFSKVREAFGKMQIKGLAWGQEIIELFESERRTTIYLSDNAKAYIYREQPQTGSGTKYMVAP